MATIEEVVKMWDEKYPHFPIIRLKGYVEHRKLVETLSTDDRIAISDYKGKKYAKISLSDKIPDKIGHTICYTFEQEGDKFSVFFEKLPDYYGIDANSLHNFCKEQFGHEKIKGIPFKYYPDPPSPSTGVVKLILNIPEKTTENIVDCMKDLIFLTQRPLSELLV